jgi:hypothetical protein
LSQRVVAWVAAAQGAPFEVPDGVDADRLAEGCRHVGPREADVVEHVVVHVLQVAQAAALAPVGVQRAQPGEGPDAAEKPGFDGLGHDKPLLLARPGGSGALRSALSVHVGGSV